MDEELLPHIKYRISIDFGKVEMATSNSSRTCSSNIWRYSTGIKQI